jgi:hypothetical protein
MPPAWRKDITMSGRVFISHASHDHDVAEAVCDALEARGVPCWIAPRDIMPGKEYAHALYDAIVECRALLLILSAQAIASAQVRREIEQASRDGDPIIAFRIDDAELGPALQFHLGRVDWLAPPSVDLATQIGMLADSVQARLASDAARLGTVPVKGGYRPWRGYPGVLRRLTATWATALIVTTFVISAIDLGANIVALGFARRAAPVNAAVNAETSPFAEEEPIERIAALSGIQLIVVFPTVFVWLAWLCGAYLTLEHIGIRMGHPAARVPGRFMWPGLRLTGGANVLQELWRGSTQRRDQPAESSAAATPPRWLWPFWFTAAALPAVMLFTAIVANEDEWSDEAILVTAITTDVWWLLAGALCLRVLRPVEKRLRWIDAELNAGGISPSIQNVRTG